MSILLSLVGAILCTTSVKWLSLDIVCCTTKQVFLHLPNARLPYDWCSFQSQRPVHRQCGSVRRELPADSCGFGLPNRKISSTSSRMLLSPLRRSENHKLQASSSVDGHAKIGHQDCDRNITWLSVARREHMFSI
jgi:hypothetical protein